MQIHRLKPTVLATMALLSAASACSKDPASPGPLIQNGAPNGIVAGTLEVTASNGNVTLRNTTEQQLGYMIVEKDQMVVMMYPPCGANCEVLVQGQSASVAYHKIPGYVSHSTHARVMWWRYTTRSDGTRVAEGAIETTLVQLK